jgi:hypothetical protein
MTKGISQIVGTGEGAGDARVTVYRALRRIICTPCGGTIMEGELFTRHNVHSEGVRILSRCQKCAPFTLGMDGQAKRPRSKMLDALLAPRSGQEGDSSSKEAGEQDAIREAVAKRLGPALRRRRDR